MSLPVLRRPAFTPWARYGAAVASSALALIVILIFDDLSVEPNTFMPYIAAVMFSSWYGGLGPGLLSAILTGLCCICFSLPPAFLMAVKGLSSAARLVEFMVVALLICLLNDARRAAQRRAETARAEAETANRTKDQFLAMVSHELRTPINSILGWTRLMRSGRLGATESARGLETIERSAVAQNRMIGELLDVTRIIAGKLPLQLTDFEVKPVVEAAIDTLRPVAQAKSIQLEAFFDALPAMVCGDSERLQQVVWNLLSNAIKFTPEGGRVALRCERIDSWVQIIVRDTGVGIRPEFLPHVFDRFSQQEGSDCSGLGLGLSIVRHLVELHGGMIRAESEGTGRGATFTVKLPTAAAAEELQSGHTGGRS